MEWQLILLVIFGAFVVLLLTGLPVALCFMLINLVGVYIFWGGQAGLFQFIYSIVSSLTTFSLLPIPLFILLGEVIFISGIGIRMMDVLDEWMGALPGRLGLLAVSGGTLFATLTGTSVGSAAMLGSVLSPEMEKRGYKKAMSLGPIMGSGGLAMMIPPSSLAIFVGAVGRISIGRLLMAIIVPGLVMAVLYASYIIIRCWLQPSIAPAYEPTPSPLSHKIVSTVRYVLPLGLIIFLVIGFIFLGIATPSESAAMGVLGSFILAASYRKLNWELVKKSAIGTLRVTVMVFMIICGAAAFSQILAFSGASRGLVETVAGLPLAPIGIIILMQVIVLIMGMFMEVGSILMITLPIFVPIILTLGLNPVWFGAIMLLNMEMAVTTPPFGILLFVMKGVAPPGTTMGDVIRAGLPFLGCDAVVMALMITFPMLVLWLPGLMR